MKKINIGLCEIRIEPGEFKGKDYHVFYLGRFYITCQSMKSAMWFVNGLNNEGA